MDIMILKNTSIIEPLVLKIINEIPILEVRLRN